MTIRRAAELEERVCRAEMARLQRQRERVNRSLRQQERELHGLLRRQREMDDAEALLLAEQQQQQQHYCHCSSHQQQEEEPTDETADPQLALLLRSPDAERQRRVLMVALEQGWTQLMHTPQQRGGAHSNLPASPQQYCQWQPAWSKMTATTP